jgi:hypothetical protein
MTDPDILEIARAAIAEGGEGAAEVIKQRAEAHKRDGELEGALFWERVAEAVSALLRAKQEEKRSLE